MKSLVAGIGCTTTCSAAEIIGLVSSTMEGPGLHAADLAALASIETRASHPALLATAAHFGVPLRVFSAQELGLEEDRLATPSELVRTVTGAPGVSEAAALKAGTLVVAKHKSALATCAIGRSPSALDVERFGRPALQMADVR